PNVTEGYWNKPEKTEKAFTDDGWFRTGDIMEIKPDGYLKFHDRVKNLLVLSTGKNVAPEPIEDKFATSEIVDQCMVIGDSRKFISALIVPDMEGIKKWARRNGVNLPDERLPLAKKTICETDETRQRIQEEIDAVNADLESHETIKKYRLAYEEFTEENDMLTPTLKKKRRNILERYEDKVEEMYGDSDEGQEAQEVPVDD
ncbi:MAG: AMP-binding protein, partial [Halobacteria archaeon]|nr:AMP-binding protein [Halobacteria archaeon]